MSCHLRISGDFDPTTLALLPTLEFEIRHRKGEPGRGGVPHKTSMIQCGVSHADLDDLEKQFADMISFVRTGGSVLAEFCKHPGFSEVVFDFGSGYSASCAFLFRSFPRDVVAAAATCGAAMEISLYPAG